MAPDLDEGVSALCYRALLAFASTVSLASIVITFWLWFPKEDRPLGALVLLPVFIPYGLIPLRLYRRRLRAGLNFAIAMGGALLVPGIMLPRYALRWDRRWWLLGSLVLALSMQLLLVVLAAKAYIPLPRQPHSRLKFLVSMAYGFFLFGSFWLFYRPVPLRIEENESAAMRYLETSALSAEFDAHEHGGLYAESIGGLAPNSNPECALGPDRKNPLSEAGYVFEYRGIQPSRKSQNCTRFGGFTITARPAVYGQTGIRSFRIKNRNLAIHFTSENRPANDWDPETRLRHLPN